MKEYKKLCREEVGTDFFMLFDNVQNLNKNGRKEFKKGLRA
jgi:hypothetical protein